MNFAAILLVMAGIHEAMKCKNAKEDVAFMKKCGNLKVQSEKLHLLNETKRREVWVTATAAFVRTLGGLVELAVVVGGMVMFPAPFRWWLLSTLALPVVTAKLLRHPSPAVATLWWRIDTLYCAGVYIIGTLLHI